jgi:hypothetical protein
LFLLGILQGLFLEDGDGCNTKRPDMGCGKESHAARAADQVVEPEAGRTVNRK